MDLATAFAVSAEKDPVKTAVYWGDSETSFGQLAQDAGRVEVLLRDDFGVRQGDRVGLWVKNCPEFIAAFFGILRAGGTAVPINNFLKPDEVAHIINDAGINTLITDGSLAEALAPLAEARPQLKSWQLENLTDLPQRTDSAPAPHAADESDLAVIIYTSGTTGHPKGAMLSHGNLLHNIASCKTMLSAVDFDRFVLLLPMFHSFMLTVCNLLPLLTGGSIVLIKSLHPPKNVMMEIIRHKATIMPAIPPFFRAMLHESVPTELPLRVCISGAAPLPVETLNAFNEKFPFPLIEGYGLSEAAPAVSFNPLNGPWIAGSIGVPIPNVEMSVQDDSGNTLADSEVGEICIRGGNVMQGYWNKEEETAKTIRNGWLCTGDIGYRNSDGYFFITDRKKDMLLVNGINVYPREIEEVIYQFPGVKEAGVIGRKDARKGEMPIAYVAANDDVTLDEKELLSFIREKMAAYKTPRSVVILDALPRNSTGKILKTALRELDANR